MTEKFSKTIEEKAEAYYQREVKSSLAPTAIRLAYIAGAKENGVVWHDLRKAPNDLPKEDCEVVSLHESGNKTILKWKNGGWTCAIMIPIVAWCEIPRFEE